MTFTEEQKALLRPILQRLMKLGPNVSPIIDLLCADDRDARLAVLVRAEHTALDAHVRDLPNRRAAEDARLTDTLRGLDDLGRALEESSVAAGNSVV